MDSRILAVRLPNVESGFLPIDIGSAVIKRQFGSIAKEGSGTMRMSVPRRGGPSSV